MRNLISVLCVTVLLGGCAMSSGPFISKSDLGNLEVNVYAADKQPESRASLYVDTLFVGNLSKERPVLYIKAGEHTIRVECPTCKPYERKILVLGKPNHQVLNVFLEKE